MAFDYKSLHTEVLEELSRLHAEKIDLEGSLEKVNQEIEVATRIANAAALQTGELPIGSDFEDATTWLMFANPAELHAGGMTMAIKAMMDFSPDKDYEAKDVRKELEEHGWDWGKYSNPLSTIHTVLKRLFDSGAVAKKNGKYHSKNRVVVTSSARRGALGIRMAGSIDASLVNAKDTDPSEEL